MTKRERVLILNVDRDNDIGIKADVSGPIIGRDKVIEAGVKLGLKDPEDSDFNAIFEAVKVYDELKKKYKSEVAVITGDKNVGIQSDKKIADQLKSVLKKFPADFAILVTDGSEDEHIIPIIQNMVPILSVKKVVVKQAEELESSYYKIKDFIHESLENPRMARLVFGLPSLVLITYALFGIDGWRAIVGIAGIYLFIKGFKLDDYVLGVFNELKMSLIKRRFAFFSYIVSMVFCALGMYRGYTSALEWLNIGIFETGAGFVSASVYFFFIAGTIAWIGRNVHTKKRSGRKIAAIPLFGFAISLVIYNAAELILKPESFAFNFLFSIVFGFSLLFVAVLLEWKG